MRLNRMPLRRALNFLLVEKWRNDAENQLRTGNQAKNGRVSNKANLGKRSQQAVARRHRMEVFRSKAFREDARKRGRQSSLP
jgi:hypothetical protein